MFESPVHSAYQSLLKILTKLYIKKIINLLLGLELKNNTGSKSQHPISQVNKPNVNKPKSKKQKCLYRLKGPGSRDCDEMSTLHGLQNLSSMFLLF